MCHGFTHRERVEERDIKIIVVRRRTNERERGSDSMHRAWFGVRGRKWWWGTVGVVGAPFVTSSIVGKDKETANDASSWTRNLHFTSPSGFWANAAWYDLQMERRIPETAMVLKELVFALPPMANGSRVADLGAGSGRLGRAVKRAYPQTAITFIDVDEERGALAVERLEDDWKTSTTVVAKGTFERKVVNPERPMLPGGEDGYDAVVALQAIRHMVAPASHYAEKHNLMQRPRDGATVKDGYAAMFFGIYQSLRPGGHVFIGDRVAHGHPGVYEHCELLKEAGFCDVDVAWRFKGWFVVGARRPLREVNETKKGTLEVGV